jgi:LTXXQ motif family protein
MKSTGSIIAMAALAAAAIAPTPTMAFGLRIGPFHIGIPFGIPHRHHAARAPAPQTASLPDEQRPNGAPAEQAGAPAQRVTAALLDPALALPAVYDGIFWPSAAVSSSPWPFGYDAIFQSAFAKNQSGAGACQPPGNSRAIMGRIQAEVRPTAAQTAQLQKLGGALAMAGQYLASACPKDIPPQPTARMQLMEWQIEKLAQALDIVRPPLAEFQQSLSNEQRARFSAVVAAGGNAAPDNMMPSCAVAPTAIDSSVERISLSVQPSDAQRDAMTTVKDAFGGAARDLDAHCTAATPADPLARLETTQARLDVTWRAVVAVQSALANLEKGLSPEQRARLDATDFAAVQ